MFESNSRYISVETAAWVAPDGRVIRYKCRRFPPLASSLPLLTQVIVIPGDRPDIIASRSLGDPLAFWQICDANDALDPLELSETPGRILNVALPQP